MSPIKPWFTVTPLCVIPCYKITTTSSDLFLYLPAGLLEIWCICVTVQCQFCVSCISSRKIRCEIPHPSVHGFPENNRNTAYISHLNWLITMESMFRCAFERDKNLLHVARNMSFRLTHMLNWCQWKKIKPAAAQTQILFCVLSE